MSDLPIENLGPYKIEGVVGRGGMGTVYAATHKLTEEKAAIKVLAPALAADDTFRERFIAEIESLKTLSHPHIVKLHGFGEADGHLFYAMELVDGRNLEQELSDGRRFNWREVVQIGINVSRALKHAHDHGIIHRDLKPANLLFNEQDDIKLTDFGIAKLFGASKMTLNDSVLGTADYMAPEQAAGEATTPRCDLYSLGCVMYALLAGVPPFKGKSIAEVVHKVRYEQHPALSRFAHDIPDELESIIDELLEKDPDDRIRTALSLQHRLRAVLDAHTLKEEGESGFAIDGYESSPNASLPPADIAERPTIFLQDESSQPTEKSRTVKSKTKKKSLDHFTRIEPKRISDGRAGDHSSALPLMFMTLTVLAGLIGGIWYSSLPPSADDLYQRIMTAAEDPAKLGGARTNVERFIRRFPDDSRINAVRDLSRDIESNRLQKVLESRARRRKETGKLSPVEVHINDAFRAHREGDLRAAIRILQGIELMFGAEENPSGGTVRVLELTNRLLPKWEEEMEAEIEDLRDKLIEHHALAESAMESEDYEFARQIWQGTIELYDSRPWANAFVDRARHAIGELDKRHPTADATPAIRDAKNVD